CRRGKRICIDIGISLRRGQAYMARWTSFEPERDSMSFGSIPSLTPRAAPSDPFDIFARRPSLPSTPNDLWGGQKEALQDWVKARKLRDVLISLNTGSGKTLLGV